MIWELEIDDTDNDRTYVPRKVPENSAGPNDLSDSETEVEFEEDLDDLDYVRVHVVNPSLCPTRIDLYCFVSQSRPR